MVKELNADAGFTLVELLITIVIAAILLAVAVPSFRAYQAGQQVRSAAADLVSALNFARSEAVKRMANVSVAPAGGGWVSGWSVKFGATEIRNYSAAQGVTISGPGAALSYSRDGRTTAAVEFTVTPTGSTSASSRCVRVSISGKPTTSLGECS